jgi:hypothetical protein
LLRGLLFTPYYLLLLHSRKLTTRRMQPHPHPFSTHGQLSAAQGSSTTVSRSDIRLTKYLDSSAHGLVRGLLIGYFLIHLSPQPLADAPRPFQVDHLGLSLSQPGPRAGGLALARLYGAVRALKAPAVRALQTTDKALCATTGLEGTYGDTRRAIERWQIGSASVS